MKRIVLIVHNVRSAHNVGSLLRTADGLGINQVYLTGYTPYPEAVNDERLPHLRSKITKQIHKTALGAEESVNWHRQSDIKAVVKKIKKDGYLVTALEQTHKAIPLKSFNNAEDVALVVGNEVEGLDELTLKSVDTHLQIPMLGSKESFNVTIAAAIALYHLRFAQQ